VRLSILSTEFPPGPGGIGSHAHALASELSRLGWQVTVLSPQDYAAADEVTAFNARQPFEVLRWRSMPLTPLRSLCRGASAWRHVVRRRPDALLATGQRAVWLAAGLSRLLPIPWAAAGHGKEFAGGSPIERRFTRWAFERAGRVVCVSEFTRELMARGGVTPRRTSVIANGADARFFRKLPETTEQLLRKLRLPPGRWLVTTGNLTERKGQDIVVRALPHILQAHPDVRYALAGLPTRKAALQSLAGRLGVARRVHFLGRVSREELRCLLNVADVFVLTSRRTADDVEGYGIAAVEAALCGTPAVVSSGCGLSEAVAGGRTGIAVSPDDPAGVARAVTGLLSREDRRRALGDAARTRALAEQSWEARAACYDALLRGLAQGAGAPLQADAAEAA